MAESTGELHYLPRRRVGITGLGLVSSLGHDVRTSFDNLVAGETGVRRIRRSHLGPYAKVINVQLGAPVQGFELMDNPLFAGVHTYVGHPGKNGEPKKINIAKERKNYHEGHERLIGATYEAIGAGEFGARLLLPNSIEIDPAVVPHEDVGVVIGTGLGGADELLNIHDDLETELRRFMSEQEGVAGAKGKEWLEAYETLVQARRRALGQRQLTKAELKRLHSGAVKPSQMQQTLVGRGAEIVSILTGARAPARSNLGECAASLDAIVEAAELIQLGLKVVIAGGYEASIKPEQVQAFARHRGAVSPNDNPDKAPNPGDENRDGFVFGEGGAVLVVEDLEHARARGAKVHAELIGWGSSSDSFDPVEPDPRGIEEAFTKALITSGLSLDEISGAYVNLHMPATPADAVAAGVYTRLLKPSQTKGMNSTKGSTGHMLGATGAAETIFGIGAMNEDVIPPSRNMKKPINCLADRETAAGEAVAAKIDLVIKENEGFGGHDAAIILKKP